MNRSNNNFFFGYINQWNLLWYNFSVCYHITKDTKNISTFLVDSKVLEVTNLASSGVYHIMFEPPMRLSLL